MKKPLIWINSLSSALHAGIDSVVSQELRATTSEICYWNRGHKDRAPVLPVSNDTGSANDPGHSDRGGRKVA